MRNLYSHLGIKTNSTTAEIRSAIASISNAEIKADASAVLLNEDRRRIYNQLNNSMICIGRLRAELGLNNSDGWRGETANEYSRVNKKTRSALQEFHSKASKLRRTQAYLLWVDSLKHKVSKAKAPAFFLGGILLVLWIVGSNFGNSEQEKRFSPAKQSESPQLGRPSPDYQVDRPSPGYQLDRPLPGLVTKNPEFQEPILPTPESGAIRLFTIAERIAPFEIQTSGLGNYLVKLQEIETQRDVLDVFVRGGDTIEIEVPLGRYTVKYASGDDWYGYTHLFGPRTSYNMAESAFHFRVDGRQVSGFTITLYQVSDGNLRTNKIGADQF